MHIEGVHLRLLALAGAHVPLLVGLVAVVGAAWLLWQCARLKPDSSRAFTRGLVDRASLRIAFEFTSSAAPSLIATCHHIHDLVLSGSEVHAQKACGTQLSAEERSARQTFLEHYLCRIVISLKQMPVDAQLTFLACVYHLRTHAIIAPKVADVVAQRCEDAIELLLSGLEASVRDFCEAYTMHYQTIVSSENVPLVDVSTLVRSDRTIVAKKFVNAFSDLVSHNYDKLDEIAALSWSDACRNASVVVQAYLQALKLGVPLLSVDEQAVREILHSLKDVRDTLTELLNTAQIHFQFCTDLLRDIPIHLYRHQRAMEYLDKYAFALEQHFGRPSAPKRYPFVVLHVTQLSDDFVTVKTPKEYENMCKAYEKLVSIHERARAAIPGKFPRELPNLGSHDGKPTLLVRDEADYTLIIRTYAIFLQRLDNVKRAWQTSLRDLCSLLTDPKLAIL